MAAYLDIVDAFTHRPFSGNPAAVCLLDSPMTSEWMQMIATEMNLSETAFLWETEGGYCLRWFTPAAEVRLCGHATLASAHVLWERGLLPLNEFAKFNTASGWLTCERKGEWIEMDFPADIAASFEPPANLCQALGVDSLATLRGIDDWMVEVANEATVRSLRPHFGELAELRSRGVIVTAKSDDPGYDFVSRFFAPAVGVNEDPVTGSAHCVLGPWWADRLGKSDLVGRQLSKRGGVVRVGVRGDRVLLGGQAVTVSRVELLRTPE